MGVTGFNILSLECVSAKIVILLRSNKEELCFYYGNILLS